MSEKLILCFGANNKSTMSKTIPYSIIFTEHIAAKLYALFHFYKKINDAMLHNCILKDRN